MVTIQFKHCRVVICPTQEWMVTIFEDGTEVPAQPNWDEESRARAESLGYGREGVWAMTIDHEIGHTILAEMDGLNISPALWFVAHPNTPITNDMREIFAEEESRVLELQRFYRTMCRYKSDIIR